MALLIARTAGTMTFDVGQGEVDLISIAKLDAALGFTEDTPLTVESIVCVPVTYGTQAETGPTPARLHALANSTGFTSPPHVVIFPVTDTFVLSSGLALKGNGVALDVGESGNPFTAHVATFYDITLCAGAGMWCDAEGGGTTPITTDVMLYHELSHCFHMVTGTLAPTNAQEEVNAEIDENDMRDVRGLTRRDVNSHNGGCGGGPPPCCIVASLATESPYSPQVAQLRHFREHVLRRSDIGDELFRQLHFQYYQFSPEVCTLMGKQAELKGVIADYFVAPLLAACDLLRTCADPRASPAAAMARQAQDPALGVLFDSERLQETGTILALADMEEDAFLQAQRKADAHFGPDASTALLAHVNRATANLPYIRWALLQPLALWHEAATLHVQGASEPGERIRKRYDAWIAMMPIAPLWNTLPRLSFIAELDALGRYMHTRAVRAVFGARLRGRHAARAEDIDAWIRAAAAQEATC